MLGFIKSIGLFFVYPLYLIVHAIFFDTSSNWKRTWIVILSLVIFLPLWSAAYYFGSLGVYYGMQYFGLLRLDIPVSGDSMLPTLTGDGPVSVRHYPQLPVIPAVQKIYNLQKLEPPLTRGDMVVFRNVQTVKVFQEQHEDFKGKGGFVKRVVALPGDTVYIRDGFVYVNDEPITEPYILKPRSTFGNDFLADCTEVKVPKNKFFVLGDNRKLSVDSRYIGFVDREDIFYYLPFPEQKTDFGKRWRDASSDLDSAFSSELDTYQYLELLNAKRRERGVPALKYNEKMEKSAKLRAENMLKYNDLSFEATRSGYTMDDAFADVGYSNIVYAELPVLGYYDAQELIDAYFEFPSSRDYLLNKEYQEIGLSTFIGQLNGCPAQIVVQHLAGYVPPNYPDKDIQSWRDLVAKLTEVQAGWQKLKEVPDFYNRNKEDTDRVNYLIQTRLERARILVSRMEANQWYTGEEKQYVEQDPVLLEEQNKLAEKLNSVISGQNSVR